MIQEYFARTRVSFGFFVGTGAVLFLRPCDLSLVMTGLSISFAGLALRSWAAGTIKKSKELATEGPYALVRHPLYLGSLLIAGGFAVALTCPDNWLLTISYWALLCFYFAASYTATIIREEKTLEEKFPDQWNEYKRWVPALIPYRIPALQAFFARAFSVKQYMKNREYQAVTGWVAAAVFLFVLLPGLKQQSLLPMTSTNVSIAKPPSVEQVKPFQEKLVVNQTPAARKIAVEAVPEKQTLSDAAIALNNPQKQETVAAAPVEEKVTKLVMANDSDDLFEEKGSLSLMNPWFGTALVGTSALSLFDNRSQAAIQKVFNQRSGREATQHGGAVTKMGELSTGLGIAGSFYTIGMMSNSLKAKRIGVVGVQALLVNSLVSEGIENSLGRKSPSNGDADDFDPFSSGADALPSRYTSSAFTLASVVAEENNSIWVDSLSYGLASLIGVSSLSDNQNWASDVALGALLGVTVGKTVSRLEKRKGWSKRLYTNGRDIKYEQKF